MAIGVLEARYLAVHPGATTGLELCRFFQHRPDEWFTHSQIKAQLGCSDRIIREHVPEALNGERVTIEVDKSQRAWRYRYQGP
ncbi:hypothetical protein [Aquihabitans sp. McL0605]|uniref:hypothetical protein n=1 Tax=Aquihabitans sp. McL0605 TaxID=3415671 RepID=UPI003CF8988C